MRDRFRKMLFCPFCWALVSTAVSAVVRFVQRLIPAVVLVAVTVLETLVNVMLVSAALIIVGISVPMLAWLVRRFTRPARVDLAPRPTLALPRPGANPELPAAPFVIDIPVDNRTKVPR